MIYDNARVKHIKAEDFVFDKFNCDNWDKCAKIYRTYLSIDEIFSDVDENCQIPFRECNYIKEDIDDTAELFTEEIVKDEEVSEVASTEVDIDQADKIDAELSKND